VAKHRWQGPDRLRQLEHTLRQASEVHQEEGSPALSRDALSVRHALCSIQHLRGRFSEAHQGLTEILALECQSYGQTSSETLITRHNLVFVLRDLNHPAEAAEQLRTILTIETALFGIDHREVVRSRAELAEMLVQAGRLAEALEQYEELMRSSGSQNVIDAVPDITAVVSSLGARLTNTRFGVVKSWVARGRHGYIIADDGRELVFSEDSLSPVAAEDAATDVRVPPGTRVRFEIKHNRHGWQEATEVTPVTD
jgi:hypothetical protein